MSQKFISQKQNLENKAKSQNQKARFLNDKEESEHPPQMRNAQRFFRKPKATQEMIVIPQPSIQYAQPYVPKPIPIPEAIKQIDKKILAYRRVMERERHEKLQREKQEQQKLYENEEDQKRALDFMTNPQIVDQKEEELSQQEQDDEELLSEEPRAQELQRLAVSEKTSYSEAVKKREQIYDHTLQRMYEKRQNPVLFAKFKKKPPILNITSKNKITKGNGRMDPEEHKLRVFNRENVPTIPDLIIPSFTVKKDQMAKNILAYLKEYTPLFRGYKNYEYPKCVQNILQEEIDSLPKQ
ncbi:unnamed protein product (macronuclear) [Paramecium tetraurelia]|uniref:Uncharacterized protein n=1 Tax=Paramecium tetraurelia TaxID=5888 RepID=A0BEF1_PARTE|nr:uncharacterized protein GSPATT00027951001 [Paramecium tetraurelia]CAK56918.1 unnamed protein product [Paramecium tetraurelia]|eukprot:XP_001424316.1 hypothetical protein (macronuclear) [Paramecium tetraurelia strain d4-2]